MSSRDRYYRQVIRFLEGRPGRCAYTDSVAAHVQNDNEWTKSLLAEMRERELVVYHSGWGWRLRKGVSTTAITSNKEVSP